MISLLILDPLPAAPAPVTEASKLVPEPRLGELAVTGVTPDSVGLLWTVPEGEFDSFMVQYKDRDGQPHVESVGADLREVTIPGLEPSRKYKFLLFGVQDGKRHSQVSVEAKTGEDCLRSSSSPTCGPVFPEGFELPAGHLLFAHSSPKQLETQQGRVLQSSLFPLFILHTGPSLGWSVGT